MPIHRQPTAEKLITEFVCQTVVIDGPLCPWGLVTEGEFAADSTKLVLVDATESN
jgi:hypothetical protein